MSKRILVVEDQRKIAAFLRRGLEEEGYVVDLAVDGGDDGRQARCDAVSGIPALAGGQDNIRVLRLRRPDEADLVSRNAL